MALCVSVGRTAHSDGRGCRLCGSALVPLGCVEPPTDLGAHLDAVRDVNLDAPYPRVDANGDFHLDAPAGAEWHAV